MSEDEMNEMIDRAFIDGAQSIITAVTNVRNWRASALLQLDGLAATDCIIDAVNSALDTQCQARGLTDEVSQ